ncbi:MAG: hypothetical protein FJ087_21005, partial [Deltaproteobacteria bacterium]|nr:hypothetical protein [Deltaproteobacteria bacterium]
MRGRRFAPALVASASAAAAAALFASCGKDLVSGLRFECSPDDPSSCGPGHVCAGAPAGHPYRWWCVPRGEVEPTGEPAPEPLPEPAPDPLPEPTDPGPVDLAADHEPDPMPDPAADPAPDPGIDPALDPTEDEDPGQGSEADFAPDLPPDHSPDPSDDETADIAPDPEPEPGPDEPGPDPSPENPAFPDAAGETDVPCTLEEECNGADDDCDGETDEGLTLTGAPVCATTGVCLAGASAAVARCENGAWVCDWSAVPDHEPDAEKACDGKDNDCDGETDEDFLFLDWDLRLRRKGDGCGTGACAFGTVRCAASGTAVECPTSVLSKVEVCDYADNDCDGVTDDGQAYLGAEVGLPCQGVGECGKHPGVVECHAVSKKATCSTNPEGTAAKDVAESCNGRDDDCNGLTDDGLGIESPDCTCKVVGQCSRTTVVAKCKLGQWICDYSLVPGYEAPAELSCDDKDNDCDGEADDDFTLVPADGVPRKKGDACGTGACQGGEVVCSLDGKGLICSNINPLPEACNGKDDDCDGQTDENADVACNDLVPCTVDTCEAGGTCAHVLYPDWCRIGTSCWPAGTLDPTNSCRSCDPSQSVDSWTVATEGSACDLDNSGCTQGDRCVAGTCTVGTTQTCTEKTDACNQGRCVSDNANAFHCVADPVSNETPCDDANPCTWKDVCTAGKCAGAAYLCEDLMTCTDNVCDGKGGCSFPLKVNYCLISGNCISAGAQDPAAQCKACRPTIEKFLYAAKDEGTPCSDNNACTDNDHCSS